MPREEHVRARNTRGQGYQRFKVPIRIDLVQALFGLRGYFWSNSHGEITFPAIINNLKCVSFRDIPSPYDKWENVPLDKK